MKLREIMTRNVVTVDPEESVEVAARTLNRHNIGCLPVANRAGKLCGMVTDRDLVTRCIAAGKSPAATRVREVMTGQVTTAQPDMESGVAAHLMGRLQVRRLPVVEQGLLCGMVSLGDLAGREDTVMDAADALADISDPVSHRENL